MTHRAAITLVLATGQVREGHGSSTTSAHAPDRAWALYLDKGAVGVGQKAGAHVHVRAGSGT